MRIRHSSDRFLVLSANIRRGCLGLQGTNALAYISGNGSDIENKCFIKMRTGYSGHSRAGGIHGHEGAGNAQPYLSVCPYTVPSLHLSVRSPIHPSVCLPVCPSAFCRLHLFFGPTVRMSVGLSDWLSVCLIVWMHLSICLYTCLSVFLSACLHVYLSVCLPVCLSACQSINMFVCLPACLSLYQSVCLSVCVCHPKKVLNPLNKFWSVFFWKLMNGKNV